MHVGMAIMTAGVLVGTRSVYRLPGFYWGALFALWQVVGAVVRWGDGSHPLVHHRYGTAFIWFAMYPAILVLADAARRRTIINALAATVCASFLLSLVQFFVGHGGDRPFRVSTEGAKHLRSAGFMPLHLTQGFMMTIFALIFTSCGAPSGTSRITAWAGRAVSVAAVLLANSRSGMVSLLGGFSVWFATSRGGGRWVSLMVILLGVPLILGWMWFINVDRVKDMVDPKNGRYVIWDVAAHIIVDHPLLGVGEEKYKEVSDRYLKTLYPDLSQDRAYLRTPDAHNSALGLAAEHGIPGVILFAVFMASILRHLYRRRNENLAGWQLGCGVAAALAVGSQFEHYAGHSAPSYAFVMGMAFAVALDREWIVQLGLSRELDALGECSKRSH
jgi:O-antigen ligase